METPNVAVLVVLIFAVNALMFVAIWFGVVALISVMSGWKRLARAYAVPPADVPAADDVQTFRVTSARMNGARYRGCLTVSVGPRGIGMVPWALFRTGHAPLRIPWSAVRSVAPTRYAFMEATQVEVAAGDGRDSAVRIVLMPDVGRAVLAARPSEVAATFGGATPYPPPAAT